MNYLTGVNLNNRYFALRHGESMPNVLGIILSSPEEGVHDGGLSKSGMVQVRRSAESALEKGILDSDTVIYSSDFQRAMETAEIARRVFDAHEVIPTVRLRERYFGEWDKTTNKNYDKVWVDDKVDSNHHNYGVESADEVQDRTTQLIMELEKKYTGKKILLVSHGDALQIMQTGFLGISPSKHRTVPHLNVAEIRELVVKK